MSNRKDEEDVMSSVLLIVLFNSQNKSNNTDSIMKNLVLNISVFRGFSLTYTGQIQLSFLLLDL